MGFDRAEISGGRFCLLFCFIVFVELSGGLSVRAGVCYEGCVQSSGVRLGPHGGCDTVCKLEDRFAVRHFIGDMAWCERSFLFVCLFCV